MSTIYSIARKINKTLPAQAKQLEGKRVKTIAVMRNGYAEIPIGTKATVTYAHGGAHLKTDPCPCCGISIFISKVHYTEIEVIEEATNADEDQYQKR